MQRNKQPQLSKEQEDRFDKTFLKLESFGFDGEKELFELWWNGMPSPNQVKQHMAKQIKQSNLAFLQRINDEVIGLNGRFDLDKNGFPLNRQGWLIQKINNLKDGQRQALKTIESEL